MQKYLTLRNSPYNTTSCSDLFHAFSRRKCLSTLQILQVLACLRNFLFSFGSFLFSVSVCKRKISQPAKLKKQCGGVYFCVYGTAFSMPIQQKLPPPVLLFSDFADGDRLFLFFIFLISAWQCSYNVLKFRSNLCLDVLINEVLIKRKRVKVPLIYSPYYTDENSK